MNQFLKKDIRKIFRDKSKVNIVEKCLPEAYLGSLRPWMDAMTGFTPTPIHH